MNKNTRTAIHIQTVSSLVWPWFLLWSALVLILAVCHISPEQIQRAIPNSGLSSALAWVVQSADAVWIVLASATIYFALVTTEGLATARRWALAVLTGSAVISGIAAAAGIPFGPILYTERLGFKIAHLVPFGLPLLWFTLFFSSRYVVLSLWRKANPWQLAIGSGVIFLLTDCILEPFAWHSRYYWIWYPRNYSAPAWPPVQSYVTWLFASLAAAWLLRENKVATSEPKGRSRFVITWAVMNTVFLLGYFLR